MTLTKRPTPATTFPQLAELLGSSDRNYVAGRWVGAASKETFEVINPADAREVLGRFPASDERDVVAAIEAAEAASASWRRTPAPKRATIVLQAITLLKERSEALAQALTWEAGKALAEARVEVARGIAAMEYLAGEGRRMAGQTIPSEQPGMAAYTLRRPLGVVAVITPWNFPFAIPAWKLAPALVTGNTVVLKPAEQTPVCAALIVQAFHEAGLPAGVLNMVNGDGNVGAKLVAHPTVKAITFTGSTAVGKAINQAAAARLAKVQLELGGKNAAIVCADADLDLAAREVTAGAWGSCGQRCTATSRVLVEKAIVKAFTEKLLAIAPTMRVGAGLEDGSVVGPLINQEGLDKVEHYMATARSEGLTVACGGARPDGELAHGYFFQPTLLTGATPRNTVAKEEIFGPVLTLIEFDTLDQALEIANDVTYGLSSAIFTKDVSKVYRYQEEIESGLLHVNCPTVFSEVHLPFGGLKDSGFGGREMGPTVVDFYTEWQTMYLKHGV
jgi:aldehyde dehydrogenase (NAD+)